MITCLYHRPGSLIPSLPIKWGVDLHVPEGTCGLEGTEGRMKRKQSIVLLLLLLLLNIVGLVGI